MMVRGCEKHHRLAACLLSLCLLLAVLTEPKAAGSGKSEKIAGDTSELTIDQAIEIALEKNRDLQSARRTVSIAASNYRSAKSAYYPTVTGGLVSSYGAGDPGEDIGIKRLYTGGADITLSIPLDLSGAIDRNVQQTLNSLLVAKSEYINASQQLVVTVYTEYYAVLRASETIAINRAQVEYARDQLKIAEARSKTGRVPEVDVLTAKVQLNNEEYSLKVSEGEYQISLANLKNTLQLAQATKIITISKLNFEPVFFNYDASFEEGLQQRLEIKIAQLNLDSAKIALKSTYDPYMPTLNVSGNYGYAVSGPNVQDAFANRPDNPGWGTTVSINVPIFIFDGGATRETSIRAAISIRQAESDLEGTKDNISLEIRNELTSLENARERVRIMEDSSALAKESLRITELRYQVGKTSFLELSDARNNLRTSEVNYLDASD